jgi:uncharacterized protein (DUF885 family)
MGTASPSLAALSDDLYAALAAADPFVATLIHGIPGLDGEVPDLGESAQLAAAGYLLDIAARAERIPADGLDDRDRVTRDVLIHVARSEAVPYEDRHAEFAVSGYASPSALLFTALTNVSVATPDEQQSYLRRLRGVPGYLRQARERALDGVAAGRVPARRGVEQTAERLDAYLRGRAEDDLIAGTVTGAAVEDEVRGLVAESIRPALAVLLETLSGPVLASARPDERSGLLHVPGGGEMYARAVAAHTTTTRSPDEFHRLGLDLCEALRDEYAVLGQRVFGTGDFDTIVDKLRHDPDLRYASAEDILADARTAVARAEAALPGWFGRLPSAPCAVVPMNEVLAPSAVLGEYLPSSGDGRRPGRYNVNTYLPATRTRYEYETLAFHEAVPGHHLQFGLAQEMDDLPAFRRYLYVPAFGEGWGLYAERLADAMGLYSGDLFRFGMLSFDSWRACRLVVDTGLHHHGWTRQQAIDFMLANSALTPENVANEVDRYIAWPGQALAYMTGRLEIERLRDLACERLGPRFDIRGFHDAVLGNGAVPMTVLSGAVERWIAQVAA